MVAGILDVLMLELVRYLVAQAGEFLRESQAYVLHLLNVVVAIDGNVLVAGVRRDELLGRAKRQLVLVRNSVDLLRQQ